MALKSNTFKVNSASGRSLTGSHETALMEKHQGEIKRVVSDAKKFVDDRKKALESISDAALRRSASR